MSSALSSSNRGKCTSFLTFLMTGFHGLRGFERNSGRTLTPETVDLICICLGLSSARGETLDEASRCFNSTFFTVQLSEPGSV